MTDLPHNSTARRSRPTGPTPSNHQPARACRGGSSAGRVRVGEVRADSVYSLTELRTRMKWNRPTIARLKALGLRLVTLGRQRFVVGADLVSIFVRLADQQHPSESKDEG